MSVNEVESALIEIRAELTRHDPASPVGPLEAAQLAQVRQTMNAALNEQSSVAAQHRAVARRRRPMVRWAALALTAAAVVTAATAFPGLPFTSQPVSAAPARPVPLTFTHGTHQAAVAALLAAAQRQDTVATTGPVRYGRVREYAMQVNVGRRVNHKAVTTTVREVWVAPDGAAQVREYQQDTEPTGADVEVAAGLRNADHTGHYAPGKWVDPATGLSTDPATARDTLLHAVTNAQDFSPDIVLGDQVAYTLSFGTTTPGQNSALYRVLAELPGSFDAGVVRDRAGRVGQAVGIVVSGPGSVVGTSYLILNPTTGAPLQTESVASQPPPGLHLAPGQLVEQYHLFLGTGQTSALGRPATG